MSVRDLCVLLSGAAGGLVSALFGGWNAALTTLCIFMLADYATGLIVAGVFKNSPNSSGGALESRAGLKGLCKKGVMLMFVLIAHRLDLAAGSTFIKDGIVTAFICNETISIAENAGLMGLPMPKLITDAVEILKSKLDKGEG